MMKMKMKCLFYLVVMSEITSALLMHDIGHPKPPTIDVLEFSPGGADFYEKFLLQHKPVLIQGTVSHWPAVQQWGSLEYLANKTKGQDISEKLQHGQPVSFNITSSSPLAEDIYLPLIIQCEEFVKHMLYIEAKLHFPINRMTLTKEDILLMPLLNHASVYFFDTSSITKKSMEEVSSLDLKERDAVQASSLKNISYQKLDVHPGDILYIPKWSWVFFEDDKSKGMSFIAYHFDIFPFQEKMMSLNDNFGVEVVTKYKEHLSLQESVLACTNIRIPIKDILKIDLENFEKIMHLRIPRRNTRPEDVMLASGYSMPVLGLGTALLNETTYDAIKYALEVGYRMFDLAYGYPLSEVSFAKAMASQSSVTREEVFVVTKLHPRYLGYKETLQAIDMSLENLNVTYIDLYLIHSTECDDFLLSCKEGEPKGTWQESWRAMEQAKRDGKIRSLGFSNIYHDQIYELLNWSAEPISVIQNWFDPLNQDKDTRDICAKYNIRFMGFSTLGSRWKLLGLSYNPILESDTITGLAGHYDYVVSHVVLRWAIHVNVTVIPRSANPKHISQNFRSLDISLYPTDIDEMNAMESIMKDVMELEAD